MILLRFNFFFVAWVSFVLHEILMITLESEESFRNWIIIQSNERFVFINYDAINFTSAKLVSFTWVKILSGEFRIGVKVVVKSVGESQSVTSTWIRTQDAWLEMLNQWSMRISAWTLAEVQFIRSSKLVIWIHWSSCSMIDLLPLEFIGIYSFGLCVSFCNKYDFIFVNLALFNHFVLLVHFTPILYHGMEDSLLGFIFLDDIHLTFMGSIHFSSHTTSS